MKRKSTLFLKIVLILIAIGAFVFMIWEPQAEGVNANKDLVSIYFRDPFLAYAYTGSIAFFVALYQAFKLLVYIDKNKIFSEDSVKAVKTIKYCALIIVAFIVGAEFHSFIFIRGKDDTAGGTMLGLILIFLSLITTTAATIFQKLLQNALDIKSENDLTV